MTIYFVFSYVFSYFDPQTVSTLFINTRFRQLDHLPFFDMLTVSNFIWLKNQIKLSFSKPFLMTSFCKSFSCILCLIEFTSLFTVIIMIIRVFVILICRNINKNYVSFLGSIFELVGANRIHSELAVLHYSLFALSTIVLIFLNSNTSSFFQIIIIFCNQFLCSIKTNETNLPKLNHYYFNNSLVLFPLSEKDGKTLANYGKWYLRFQPFICVLMAINVSLTALMIFLVSNPKDNSLIYFGSLIFYWLHSAGVIFMWSSWTFWVSFNIYYIFVYYLFCAKILQFKHCKEYKSLSKLTTDFKQIHRVG